MVEPSIGGPAATNTQLGAGWAGADVARAPGAGPEGEGKPPAAAGLGWPEVLGDLLRDGGGDFCQLPRVVGGGAVLPTRQVVGPAAEGLAVEELLHGAGPGSVCAEPRESGRV